MSRALWHKKILYPNWLVQLVIFAVFVAAVAYTLAVVDEYRSFGNLLGPVAAILALCIVGVACTLLEIVFFTCFILSAPCYLASNCLKTAISLVFTVSAIIALAEDDTSNAGALVASLISLSATSTALVYASILVRRERMARKSGKYQPANLPMDENTDYDSIRADLVAESLHSRNGSLALPRLGSQELP